MQMPLSPGALGGASEVWAGKSEENERAAPVRRVPRKNSRRERSFIFRRRFIPLLLRGSFRFFSWLQEGDLEVRQAPKEQPRGATGKLIGLALFGSDDLGVPAVVHHIGQSRLSASRPLVIRILSNLVWNAVAAMPAGGMLSFLGYLRRNHIILEISDTGTGIVQEDQEKIFNGHYSTKQGHAGIGLLLVRNLVQRAGGEMTFATNPGRGTTFAFTLPEATREGYAVHSAQGTRQIAAG